MFALLAVLVFVLGGCNRASDTNVVDVTAPSPSPQITPPPATNGGTPAVQPTPAPVDTAIAGGALAALHSLLVDFPLAAENNNPIIPGGTFQFGRAQAGGFPGLFCPMHSSDRADSIIGEMLTYPLLGAYHDLRIGQHGIVTWEMDLDALTFTMTMRDDLPRIFWSDGVEMTLDDLVFHFYVLSHPDYQGTRFGVPNGSMLVRGAVEFKAGEVDHIEGLVLSNNNRQLTIHFTEMPPSMLFTGAILSTPVARHHFEGIPVAEMRYHQNSRDNMLGFGPFTIQTVVPGESVLLAANESYWQGRPHLDFMHYQIIDPNVGAAAMRAGQLDLLNFRLMDWEDHFDMNNATFTGNVAGSQSFKYFNLGIASRDENNEIYFIPRTDGHPITDVRVRRAIAYALDQATFDIAINHGLAIPATSVLNPFNALDWINPATYGTSPFDLDLANRILDEAGYVMGPNGFRLDLNGNPFHINFALAPGAVNEIRFPLHQQNLARIGIDFRQYGGGFMAHNAIVSTVTEIFDDPNSDPNSDMHMFMMGWSMGANPNPSSLWAHNENFNLGRFTNPTFQNILADIGSAQAWDANFLADAYRRWDVAFDYYLPAIPVNWALQLYPVNNRVANFSQARGAHNPQGSGYHATGGWHRVGLTAPTPYAHR